tara:strand:+ start:579 stop:818 length:240 start_codon:yes stop_codon:yes gene_type:complete
MKKLNNYLICLAIALITTCLLFNTTVAKNTEKYKPIKIHEKEVEASSAIMTQQREIKVRMKRMERKIIEKKSKKRYNVK